MLDKNYIILLWNRTGYLLVDQCEGSVCNILWDKSVRKRSWQWCTGRGEGGRQIIFCLDNSGGGGGT